MISWYFAAKIIMSSIDNFNNNPINLVVETRYLDWNTEFPSISVCETKSEERLKKFMDQYYDDGDTRQTFFRQKALRNIAFFKGESKDLMKCYINSAKEQVYNDILKCPTENISEISTKVYIHSTSDVPNMNFKESDRFEIKPKESMLVLFALKDVTNENGVKDVDIAQRKCRFPDENELTVYRYYSYSGCIVQCRIEKQMKLCNCTTHFTPGNTSYPSCNMKGLMCLGEHNMDMSTMKDAWNFDKTGLYCPCIQGCDDIDLNVYYKGDVEKYLDKDGVDVARVQIKMGYLPSERLTRRVVTDSLDMVVSTGSTIGLFLGASLLSFVEFIHYFILQIFYPPKDENYTQSWLKDKSLVITNRRFGRLHNTLESKKAGKRVGRVLKVQTRE
uniref:Sodium channel protein Nach n=1 Tax=Timema tahoe TaxID=61484 RepID=A0A7R9IMF1_9NEOP|nr:unnamed protein product [Timema tahoe]